jgi:hypothetical protein
MSEHLMNTYGRQPVTFEKGEGRLAIMIAKVTPIWMHCLALPSMVLGMRTLNL